MGVLNVIPAISPVKMRFAPTDVAGLMGWYDFSDVTMLFTDSARTTPVTADADPIGGVADKSGNARHLAAAGGVRPLYKTNIVNSKSVARSDGVDDYLLLNSATAALTVFIVAKNLTGGDGNARFWSLNGTATAGIYDAAGTWGYYANQALGVVSLTDADTAFSVVTVTYASASSATGHVNGTLRATFDPYNDYASGVFFVLFGSDNVSGDSVKADMAECLLYSTVVGSTDRSQIHAYLGAKYGITVV